MTRTCLALLIVAALGRAAHAGVDDDLATYVKNVAADPKAAAAHLTGCDALVTPRGELRRPCKISLAELVGGAKGVTLTAKNVHAERFDHSDFAYVDADVEARAGGAVIATFHVVEIDGPNPEDTETQPMLVAWSKLVADKDAAALARAGKLPAPPRYPAGPVSAPPHLTAAQAADRDTLANEASADVTGDMAGGGAAELLPQILDHDGVVIGSAAGQRLAGASGKRALKGWKIKLVVDGPVASGGLRDAGWAVARVDGTLADKTVIPYVAVFVFLAGDSDRDGATPVLAQFAVPQ
jgi:hypothetical protein